MSNNNELPKDKMERATAALRHAPVSASPPPQLVPSTVEALQSLDRAHTARINLRRTLMFRIARYGSVAAAIVLVTVLAGWLFLMDHTAASAFADVVENIKNAKSVTFITKMPTIIQGTKKGTLRQKFHIQGDAFRMEIPSAQEGVQVPADAPPIMLMVIGILKQGQALQLDMVAKTAKRMPAQDEKTRQHMAKAFADPIKELRQLKDQDAERIGEEELNGRKTQVYRLKKSDLIFMGLTVTKPEAAKLWVDAKSGLPVRLAVERPTDDGKVETMLSIEEFSWNEALDPGLFKLEVPKDFTLLDK